MEEIEPAPDKPTEPADQLLVQRLLTSHPKDAAEQVRDLPLDELRTILRTMPDEFTGELIAELPTEVQIKLFESMRVSRISGIVSEMFTDDAADILGMITESRLAEIMKALPPEEARAISDLMKFPEDSAGGIMQTEFVSVSADLSIGQALEQLRTGEDPTHEPEGLFYIYAVDRDGRLEGVLRVRDLLFRGPETPIRDVMIREVRAVSVHADQETISQLFRDYGFIALPVVDDFRRLRGVVTADDILHVVEEEATEDMQKMVGITGEEEVQTPWPEALRNRLPWLYVNLVTAFLAGWVVSLFESTIASYAALAIFLPIIAGQGGNAGSQTLTIMVRGMALGQVRLADQKTALLKEICVGLASGIAIGLVVGVVSWLWKGKAILGVVVCLAMIGNMVAATVSGVLIPTGLKTLKIDPALASAIMLTTVTDVLGFFMFLGLAALGIHYFPEAF